jgi:LacI family transcriptional regulator
MAVGVYLAARERGLNIPQDVSVVGFDDAPIATRLWPPLTSVRLPLREMGRLAGEILAPGVHRGRAPAHDIKPELIVRASSASVA